MLSEKAQKVFERKYAQTKPNGKKESWQEACWRVSYYVAQAELEHGATQGEALDWAKKFYQIIANRLFIPGGRILANAGTDIKNMFNCFVIPVEDSREGIYDALGKSAEIFAHGGGIGYNFSHLRERGAEVKGTGGQASGPLSFMELFNHTGEVIAQASRRGAQMGVLNVDHPDIESFIEFKSTPNAQNERYIRQIRKAFEHDLEEADLVEDQYDYFSAWYNADTVKSILTDNQLTHFNISVGITDEFMGAVIKDEEWDLLGITDGRIKKTVRARSLMRKIAKAAWRSGDPGVIFLDCMEEDNMTPYLGKLEAVNPCSEVTLLPYEPCCLGSINLSEMVEDGKISQKKLSYVTTVAIRFLDNVHTLNETPVEEVNEAARDTRRLGLGVMGWADALVKVKLPYDSEEAYELAGEVMKSIRLIAWDTSRYLAEERGPFDQWVKEDVKNIIPDLYEKLPKLRNVAVTSIAPTGTIALIADVNSGIEPFFALSYKRYITEGVGHEIKDTIIEVNPHVKSYFEEKFSDETGAVSSQEVDKAIDILINNREDKDGFVSDEDRNLFKTASEINWKDHIRMQAAFQEYVDNAISKTINMPEDATIKDIMQAYIYAWEKGLKSVAVYRDNSKTFQILNK